MQEAQKDSQEQEAVVREHREKTQNGQKGIRGLKARVELEYCISKG